MEELWVFYHWAVGLYFLLRSLKDKHKVYMYRNHWWRRFFGHNIEKYHKTIQINIYTINKTQINCKINYIMYKHPHHTFSANLTWGIFVYKYGKFLSNTAYIISTLFINFFISLRNLCFLMYLIISTLNSFWH